MNESWNPAHFWRVCRHFLLGAARPEAVRSGGSEREGERCKHAAVAERSVFDTSLLCSLQHDAMLAEFGITTIGKMAEWKFFKIARAIEELASAEQKGKRPEGSKQNFNGAVDKVRAKVH